MDYIDYILPVYFDKAEEPDIQGNGFFIDKLFITAAHILEKDAASIGIPYIYWKGEKLLLNCKIPKKGAIESSYFYFPA